MSENKKFHNEWNKNNSLFAFWVGNIDIHQLYRKNVTIEIDKITDRYFEIINEMYNTGARNILILTIFNKWCVSNGNCNIKNDILRFNSKIIKFSEKIFENHPDTNFIIYNTMDKLIEIVSNCEVYKFKDCTKMWKDNKKNNLTDYLWVNSHLTDHGNKILAEDINNLLNSINN